MNKTLDEAKDFIEAVKGKIPSNDIVDAVVGAPNIFTQKLEIGRASCRERV